MSVSDLAGKPAPLELLTNIPRLVAAYYTNHPDPDNPAQRIAFGTSGHRGTSFDGSFNEDHVLAISQAICEYRAQLGVSGPLFIGMDTHALSEPAFISAVEVFAANGVELRVDERLSYTPTPVISHAILTYNRDAGRQAPQADGVVITPSHNPPGDGGFKYNPPTGGPAGAEATKTIQDRANEILKNGLKGVRRMPFERALRSETVTRYDYITPYVADLRSVVRVEEIARAGLRLGVDPLGGAAVHYWDPIAEAYGLDLEVVNRRVDPAFSFMTVDHDGQIRMDCSSPYAMANLIGLKDRFDLAFGNDPDVDRHGIVTPSAGLLPPNHYLAAAVWYLFQNRPGWGADMAVGKTLVSSSIIDRAAQKLGRRLIEVPVGFKWFVDGLLSGELGFGGEESAGASFARQVGTVWTTDKDGIILDLLAAEMLAVTGRDPAQIYAELEGLFGRSYYERIDAPATPAQKAALAALSPENVPAGMLAGDPVLTVLTRAPGNNAALGGIKVITENGWFAARPSGTEDVYKIYAESFKSLDHLRQLQKEAREMVSSALESVDRHSA
ncbi:MAG: alpha-D-glucose phosphate-specific phosphoglucomutase [Chloroflexi bacterium]|nr:alpha-D-glucose phosphate-specific phosphoglucomutase [Chloroflexota bacterium]